MGYSTSTNITRNTEIAINWLKPGEPLKVEKPVIVPLCPTNEGEAGKVEKKPYLDDGIANPIDVSDFLDKSTKPIEELINEKAKELEDLKRKRDAEDANAQKILDQIKDLIAKGGDPSELLSKIIRLGLKLPFFFNPPIE